MTRKFALAAIAVAALTAAPMLATDAQAGNPLAFGLAVGLGGVLLGSAIANAQPRYHVEHRFHAEPRRFRSVSYGYSYSYRPRCRLVERQNGWGDIVVRRICR